VQGATELVDDVESLLEPFAASTVATGMTVRGAPLRRAIGASVEAFGDDFVRCQSAKCPDNVVVILDNGHGTVIPVFEGLVAELSFKGAELVNVGYEPDRVHRVRQRELRELRATTAAAAQHGRFRLDGMNADRLANLMQLGEGYDPTMAVYAAYAYYDLQDVERIKNIGSVLPSVIHGTIYDVALLSGDLSGSPDGVEPQLNTWPFAPMLLRGWELLDGYRVPRLDVLRNLKTTLRESLWTMFDERGIQMILRDFSSSQPRGEVG
jgi:hypothetical protein